MYILIFCFGKLIFRSLAPSNHFDFYLLGLAVQIPLSFLIETSYYMILTNNLFSLSSPKGVSKIVITFYFSSCLQR